MNDPTETPPFYSFSEEEEAARLYNIGAVSHDLRNVTRSEWRGLWRGAERPLMQKLLLQMAKGAQRASLTQQVALYQAAHAVLSLRGAEHEELVNLLLALPFVPLEWCDVLVEALYTGAPSGCVAEILMALRVGLQPDLETTLDGAENAVTDTKVRQEQRQRMEDREAAALPGGELPGGRTDPEAG